MIKQRYRDFFMKKRQSLGSNIILFTVVLFGIFTVVILDSLSATREMQRMKTYGSWHAALYEADDNIIRQISDNVMVDTIGNMYICGEICDLQGMNYGSIGYVDQALMDIGNIELLDGNMPQKSKEIALEAATLSRLGYSYELGQEIILPLRDFKSTNCYYESFELCGVVKNYSNNWKCGYYNLVSGFVYSGYTAEYHHAFIRMVKKYSEFARDINKICMNKLVLNDYTYTIFSSATSNSIDINLLQAVILFAGFSILLLLVNNEIIKKQPDYVVLRLLGASRSSIVVMFLHDKAIQFMLMIVFGSMSGLFTAYMAFIMLLHSREWAFCLEKSHIIISIVLNIIGVLVALIFSFVRLFQIPLRGKAVQQRRKTKRFPRESINAKTIFLRFHWNDRGIRRLSLGLSVIAISFMCISFYQTWELYSEYRGYLNEYPLDYTYGLLASYSRLNERETEEVIKRIEEAYGVEEVFGYSVSEYRPVTFEKGHDEQYASLVKSELMAYFGSGGDEYPEESEVCGSLVGIPNKLSSYYLSKSQTNSSKTYLAADEVIIYLPDYFLNDEKISECSVKEGDKIFFYNNDKTYTFKISGIMRQNEYNPFCYYIPRPYSLICNQETYNRICGTEDYVYVLVKRDEEAIAYQTDAALSKIKTSLFYTNNRLSKEEYKSNICMQLLISLLICSSGLLMIVLARYGIQMGTNHYEVYRYRTLYYLGMEPKTIKRALWKEVCIESFWGAILSLIVELIWLFTRTYNVIVNGNFQYRQIATGWECIIQATKDCMRYTHWIFLVIVLVLSIMINCLLLIIKSKPVVKELRVQKS